MRDETDLRRRTVRRASVQEVLRAALVVYAGTAWVSLVHRFGGGAPDGGLPFGVECVAVGTLTLLPTLLALDVVAGRATDRSTPLTGAERASLLALVVSLLVAVTGPVAGRLVGLPVPGSPVALGLGMGTDLLVCLAGCLPVAIVLQRVRRGPRRRSCLALGLATAVAAAGLPLALVDGATAATPATAPDVCASASRTVRYDVVAMQLDIPLNGWGDHIPDGVVYALANADASPNADDLRAEPGRVTPLVLRAAVGDCLVVSFTNQLSDRRVGMHVDGVARDVSGDGAHIGRNEDSTAAPGQTRTYRWLAQRTGQFAINDYGSGTGYSTKPEDDTTSHGLYGGLVVLPAGYTWTEPETGRDLLVPTPMAPCTESAPRSSSTRTARGWPTTSATWHCSSWTSRRASSTRTATCPPLPAPGCPTPPSASTTGPSRSATGGRPSLDHRAGKTVTLPNGTVILPEDHFCDGWTNDQDAETNRARLAKDHGLSGCLGEEAHLQSWVYGDPGKLTRTVDEVDVLTLEGAAGGDVHAHRAGPHPDRTADARRDRRRHLPPPVPGRDHDDRDPSRTARPRRRSSRHCWTWTSCRWPGSAPGDVSVTGGPDSYAIAFGQHFAGRDMLVRGRSDPASPPRPRRTRPPPHRSATTARDDPARSRCSATRCSRRPTGGTPCTCG